MNTQCNPSCSPQLVTELTDTVLIVAIRLQVGSSHDYRRQPVDLRILHTLLTAMSPDSHRYALVRAAIVSAWWMDLDWASRRGQVELLHHMLTLHHAGKRPLQYSRRGVDAAAKQGLFDVVYWWYARKDERVMWFPDVCPKALGTGVGRLGIQRSEMEVELRWVFALGTSNAVPASYLPSVVESIIEASIQQGNQAMLDLLSPYLATYRQDLMLVNSACSKLMRLFAWSKSPQAIDWLVSNLPYLYMESYYELAFRESFACGDVQWVEWCERRWRQAAAGRLGVAQDASPSVVVLQKCIEVASQAGHLHLVHWVIDTFAVVMDEADTPFPVQLDKIALAGHVHVLDWWKTSGIAKFPNAQFQASTRNIVYQLTKLGLTQVVQWWVMSSGLPFESGETPIVAAAKFGNLELLHWWDARVQLQDCRNSRSLRFTTTALVQASVHGHVHVLDWWRQNSKPFPDPCSDEAFEIVKRVCHTGQLSTVEWWYAQSAQFAESPYATFWAESRCMEQLIQATYCTQLDVLEFLCDVCSPGRDHPLTVLHSFRMSVAHPLLAMFFVHHVPDCTLRMLSMVALVSTCIRKGSVLVLHNMVRTLNATVPPPPQHPPPYLGFGPAGRQVCVLDYLTKRHGMKLKAWSRLLAYHLIDQPALFALEWMDHCPGVVLPRVKAGAVGPVTLAPGLNEHGELRHTWHWFQGWLQRQR